jgi:hypothetical protein
MLLGLANTGDTESYKYPPDPDGPWKKRYWCWIDFLDANATDKPTYCRDRIGGRWRRDGFLDRCKGVQGWCD